MATTRTRKSAPKKANASLPARTVRTVRTRPYVSAGIATGAITAVAAIAAGAYFFRKSGKSAGEIGEQISTRVKDGLAEAGSRARVLGDKLGLETATPTDKLADAGRSLKDAGTKAKNIVDDTIDEQTKAGAVAY
ncbi:hypothetical protein ABDK56_02280 [Sphingomonas sp. ASV193]|uniref:hypothetical protein n=1 Tax=Sphingomonas sp. ASV193 TaxID=3144405 RepID=UPI0032E8EE8A